MNAHRHRSRHTRRRSGRVLLLLIALVLLAGALAAAYVYATRPQPPVYKSMGPTVERLESMGRLTVVKLSISDVLEGNDYGYKGAWLIKGDVLYAIDMGKAELLEKDEAGKTATIRLPTPELLQPRVDHSRTVTYDVRRTNWIPGTGDQSKLRDKSMRKAQKLVEEAAKKEEYMAIARLNAELVLRNMYGLVDWKVKIAWEGEEPAEDEDAPADESEEKADDAVVGQ